MNRIAFGVLAAALLATPALAEDRKVNGTFTETPGAPGSEADGPAAPPTAAERPAVNEFGDKKRDGTYSDPNSAADDPATDAASASAEDDGEKARETGSRVVGLTAQELARRIAQSPRQPAPGAPTVDPQDLRRKIDERTGARDRNRI